jgi:hypothetical protein
VGAAKAAILFHHQPVGLVLFFLGGIVVALLAFFTGESDSGPHG